MSAEIVLAAAVVRVEERIVETANGGQKAFFKLIARTDDGERAMILRKEPFDIRPGVRVDVVVRAVPGGE